MKRFDVFNGDADGLCALLQWRLAHPAESRLVTGVKRDIALLGRVEAEEGDEVTVFDISLDKNRAALEQLLAAGARVRYFDHHFAGQIPDSGLLEAHIDTGAETCTSLIVDGVLEGRFRGWAVVGAFGDNFDAAARRAAEPLGLDEEALERLRQLGICLNYNGYGATVEDLYFPPDLLFRRLLPHADPLRFLEADPEVFERLRRGADDDLARARAVAPHIEEEAVALYLFPTEPWARRVSGVFSNELARAHPDRAHALLTALPGGGYVVSVRAPLNDRRGADELCRAFPTGGGRKAAAGINHLPESELERFIERFRLMYDGGE